MSVFFCINFTELSHVLLLLEGNSYAYAFLSKLLEIHFTAMAVVLVLTKTTMSAHFCSFKYQFAFIAYVTACCIIDVTTIFLVSYCL